MDPRYSGALTGALSGGATGATLGPWGALGGAALGGLAGYFGTTPDEYGQQELQTPEQQQFLSQLFGNLNQMGGQGGNFQLAQNYLSSLLQRDPQAYERFASPYMQQFEQQTVPRLAERFAGIGGGLGGGSLGSSGFAQALGGAGSDLQAKLAMLYSGLQNQAANTAYGQYGSLAGIGLGQRAFTPTYQPGSTGAVGGLASGLASGIGQKAGSSIMDMLSDYFKKEKATGTS